MKNLHPLLLILSLFLMHGAHASGDSSPTGDEDSDGVQNSGDLCADTDSDLDVDADGCSAAQLIEKAAAGALDSVSQQAINDIDELLLVPVSDKSGDKLNNAKEKLIDAIDKLGEPNVEKGLKKLSEAVGELMKAGDEGEAVTDIITSLVDAAYAEVQAAIDAAQLACSNEPDPKIKEDCEDKVYDAHDKVDDANLEIEMKGHFHHAIEDLKSAWKKAQEAFEKVPPEFPQLVECPCVSIFDAAITSYESEGGVLSDGWGACVTEISIFDLVQSSDTTDLGFGISLGIRLFTYGPLGPPNAALTCRAETFSNSGQTIYDSSEPISEDEVQVCVSLQEAICSP